MGNILLATLIALAVSMIISVFIGFLSLRVKNTYYAMITLAFAQVGVILAEKARHITNGYDGMTFRVPSVLMNKMLFYYIALGFLVISFIFMWKFTTSPTGRVLVAIRENEQRAKFIGFNTLRSKIISTVVAGAMASLAGSMYAIHMRFVSTSVLGVAKTIDALLATVIGGMGNLYGAILGTGIVNFAGEYLSKLAKVHPIFERWYIIFGFLYILIVLFAPQGVIGLIKKITNKIAAKSVKR
ncbi:MAG: branched-chain amino acid transporter, partial [Clostridia bacterium]|nr:branched-chain amino acid transporter [Clostridia bacterium]